MGKRSNFERIPRDFYPTPEKAALPLLPHLPPSSTFCEPCAGAGDLANILTSHGHTCVQMTDVEIRTDNVRLADAREYSPPPAAELCITNPPWERKTLHAIIANLSAHRPTWLLFDADWMHTQQSQPYTDKLSKIVSVGRVKWIAGSAHTGKDNCAWHLFEPNPAGPTQFYGRTDDQTATPRKDQP
ncbi:class I SAM-dependent methyltransferase [Tateyamaria sp.]|uniref:class I SAM-dependent methyltransferase n=1 Tax=Tateyamaria sp. TaxID=1929288 RepID=UPI0032A07B49